MGQRRDFAIVVSVILGLIIGHFLERVTFGLIIGLGLGLWISYLVSGRKREKEKERTRR